MSNWLKIPPPKATPFIGNFGLPFSLCATWNEPLGKYVVAFPAIDLLEGQWNETYFENEHYDEKDLKGWLPMPDVER